MFLQVSKLWRFKLLNSFWWPCLAPLLHSKGGGSLGSLLCLAGLRVCSSCWQVPKSWRISLSQLISQRTPQLVLVTLAPYGPPWGDILVAPCGCMKHNFATNLHWILRSGTQDSRFHCESIMNPAFWQPGFAFSLRIYTEFYALASHNVLLLRIDCEFCVLHCESILNTTFWHSRLLSLRIYTEFCALAPHNRVFDAKL